jgi:hypothetical protein
MLIQPFRANGEPYLDDEENEISTLVNLPPAAQIQLFRPFRDEWDLSETEGATVRVSIEAWTSLSPDPVPLFTSYGSVVNNNTNDPTTVLPVFAYPYDVDCVWNPDGEGIAAGRRAPRRPVEIPSRQQ